MDGTNAEPFSWVEEYSNSEWQQQNQSSSKKKKKRIEFSGWGSKPLIRFLDSIGRSTSQPLSQLEVAAIVTEYVNKNLSQNQNPSYDLYGQYSSIKTQPAKKRKKAMKRVICDERLISLFGKKSIPRNMIFTLLERHLADSNSEIDSDASLSCGGGEEDEEMPKILEAGINGRSVSEIPESRFAAVIPENLKLVYLRRSLVEEILKKGVDVETKIVGSFVRIKSDRNDCLRKYSHCLVRVTGLKRVSEADDSNAEIRLRASGLVKDILVSELSDVDFFQEECDEFDQRIKDGYFEKLTVAELQQKANILHEDMINHWLPRELTLLQRLIDRANEKGWRRDLPEYLDRLELLQKKDEQARILSEIPKIIAETIEPEIKPPNVTVEVNEEINDHNILGIDNDNNSPSRSIDDKRVSEAPLSDDGDDDFHLTWAGYSSEELQPEVSLQEGTKELEKSSSASLHIDDETQSVNVAENKSLEIEKSTNESLHMDVETQSVNIVENKSKEPEKSPNASLEIDDKTQSVNIVENKSTEIEKSPNASLDMDVETQSLNIVEKKIPGIEIPDVDPKIIYLSDEDNTSSPTAKSEPQIINLSDSDDDVEDKESLKVETFDDKAAIWHYLDPQKEVQGPFTLEMLKRWNNVGYFPADFSIWKIGQSPDEALPLKLILGKQVSSNKI